MRSRPRNLIDLRGLTTRILAAQAHLHAEFSAASTGLMVPGVSVPGCRTIDVKELCIELYLILCCSTVNCILIIDFLKKCLLCCGLGYGCGNWGGGLKTGDFFFQIELIEFCELGLCQV